MTSSRRVAAAFGLIVALSACSATPGASPAGSAPLGTDGSGSASGSSTRPSLAVEPGAQATAVVALVDEVILPGYASVSASTRTLADSVAALCAGGPTADPEEAQGAWRDSMAAWTRTEAYRFGPAMELEAEAVMAFAADGDKIDELLAAADPPTPFTVESLGAKGADVRGLHGAEHVLFRDGGPGDERACSYLEAATRQVAETAARVDRAWREPDGDRPAYRDQILRPGAASMWPDQQAVLTDLVNGSIHALTEVADKRLGRASGDITGTPEPEEVDAGRARSALDESGARIAGASAIFEGGLRELVAAQSPDAAAELSRQLADAADAVASIPPPLHDQGDDPGELDRVKAAYEAVLVARITLRTEVASLLGVTLSFSDSDGDS